ncbi:MAG: O-antigen ligase family protein [Veillonellales bacterium]
MTKTTYQQKKRPYYDIFLLLMLIAANLGEMASVGKLKLSWLFGLCIFYVIFTLYNNDSGLFKTNNKNKYTLLFVVFWLFYGFIQFLFTFNKEYSISFFSILIINCLLIFQITLQTKDKDDVLYYNKALIVALAINIIIGFWELRTGNHLVKLEGEKNIEYYSNKALGVFGNGNDFSTFLYLGIISLFISLFYEKKHKFLHIIMIFASLFLILVIGARGPLYGALIFLIALPVCCFLIKHINKNVLIVFICTLILLVMIFFIRYPLEEILYQFSSSGNWKSDQYRVDLIKGSLQLLFQSYLLGVGPGQSTNQLGMNPHNFFVELLADYGIFVFAGIALLFLRLFFSFTKTKNVKLSALNMAFVLSFSIVSVSSSSANRIRATWIVISILLSLLSFEEETNE